MNDYNMEVNALIAEKVMGWRWWKVATVACLCPPYATEYMSEHRVLYEPLMYAPQHPKSRVARKRNYLDGLYLTDKGYYYTREIPQFMTDLNLAKQALQEAAKGSYYEFGDGKDGPWARIFSDEGEDILVYSKTMEEAACLAALKAMNVPDKLLRTARGADKAKAEASD